MPSSVMTDSAGKVFVGMSSKSEFVMAEDRGHTPSQQSSAVNGDVGIDPSLIFRAKDHKEPILTPDQVAEALKRIGDMEDGAIRKLLAQMEGQRWLLPPDPKTELSYRFFALAQILDLIHSEEQK